MELQEYKALVAGRIETLPPEEQAVLAGMDGTPAGDIMMKVLGPELLGGGEEAPAEAPMPQDPMPQAPVAAAPQQTPAAAPPVAEPRAGLGSR
jgi:hypothetical protein|tara:strand:- start:2069 stop:2347 length:279 start_codon:yes stop_codon:yes gene_type:complete